MEIPNNGINADDVVASLNGLTGDVDLVAGAGVSLSVVGQDITISAPQVGTVTSVASADSSITVTNPTTTVDLAVVKSPKLTTARTIGTLTGDATTAGSSFDGTANNTNALTLATVNSNVGTFASVTVTGKGLVTAATALSGDITSSGAVATLATVATGATTGSSTAIPVITFNNKGLVTAVTTAAVVAPAGTLTGTTLASNVVTSSLTTIGTLVGGAVPLSLVTGLGTNVATALAVAVGSAGAFVTFNGAGGTPSSMTATNLTGTAGINITGTAPAGTLTGTTLASNVVTSSLTTIGTLVGGAVPASLVTAGTFGTGAYVMDTSLTNPLLYGSSAANGDITIRGTSSATKTTSYVILQDDGGNVGIGTTGPGYLLDVNKSVASNYITSIVNSSSSGNGLLVSGGTGTSLNAFAVTNYNQGSDLLIVRGDGQVTVPNGNVGIGTTGPGYKLEVNGTVAFTALTADTASTDRSLCQDTTSKEVKTGTGVGGLCLGTSSERYKDRIDDLKVGLKEILNLRPVDFFYKEGYGSTDKKYYGLIAEEMVKVLPELVGLNEDEEPNTADLLGLVPVLIKAVQEQQAVIEVLTERINSLKK